VHHIDAEAGRCPFSKKKNLKRFTTLDNSIEKIDKHVGYPSKLFF
jgi:hypothetical protein